MERRGRKERESFSAAFAAFAFLRSVNYSATLPANACDNLRMTRDDEIRRLLIRYHGMLALAQELALKLLDAVSVESALAPEVAGADRRFAGDAIARIESGEAYAVELWTVLGVDRRKARPEGPPPADVPHDRRNPKHRKPV
jgi:hypothetical protein